MQHARRWPSQGAVGSGPPEGPRFWRRRLTTPATLAAALVLLWFGPAALAQDAALNLDTTVSLSGVCPGEQRVHVAPNLPLTLCYEVTNSGATHLIDVQVSDDLLGPVCNIAGPMAPGVVQTCSLNTAPAADTVHVGSAQGQPSDPAGQPLGDPPVDLSDDAEVDVLQPGLAVQKTVYPGHDGGNGCAASGERAGGRAGAPVTYCFTLTNVGEAPLDALTLDDRALGVDQNAMTLVGGTEPLLPGATATFVLESSITADLVNSVDAAAQPLDDAGKPLPGGAPVLDTDSAQVELADPGLDLLLGLSSDGMCPGQPSLTVTAGSTVTFCYRATNSGDTPLLNLRMIDDRLGFVCGARGPLLPGAERLCTRSEVATASVLEQARAEGSPSDAAGLVWPGLAKEEAAASASLTVLPPRLCLGNQVFFDLDNDGRFELAGGEFGIAGIEVQAWEDADASGDLSVGDRLAGSATSGAGGAFRFCDLPSGDYLLAVDGVHFAPGGVLDGLVSSSGNDLFGQPPDPDDDQDGDDNGGLRPGGEVATRAVSLLAGTEPGAAVDGDGTDSNSAVDLGFTRLQSPTGLRLAGLELRVHQGAVRLSWRALTEGSGLGYRVQRAPGPQGPWQELGPAVIPAGPPRREQAYRVDDRPAPGTWFYRLESLDADGERALFGPLLARVERSIAFLPGLGLAR